MDIKDFETTIKPFFWVENEGTFAVCLDAGEYRPPICQFWEEEGIEGNGYDWESLAIGFLAVNPVTVEINFDSEAGMFCAYSTHEEALREFVLGFKQTCENPER